MKNLLIILSIFAATALNSIAADKAVRPNIVFILADDTGIDGYSCYGSDRFKDKTPNIDALAKSGIRFDRCYSTPLCGPSRCQIMTARYGFRTGGLTNPTAHQPSFRNEPSLARLLKRAGYITGMAGKWRQMGNTPGDWGFDEYLTDPTPRGWYWQTNYTKNGKLVQKDREFYYPDVTQEFALDFIQRHRDAPFYFYYSTHLVHGPIVRTPDTKPGKTNEVTLYDDTVAYMDKQVGQLVAELDKLGLREKTLIVFSGDNGTAKKSGTIRGREIHGAKGSMWEGGVRVPLIASWKGTAPAGRVLNDLVDFSDFFPTFAELAGAKMPDRMKSDGRSFAPQLRGEKGSPREWIYVQLGAKWYARDDGWKLNQSGELFAMKDAPFEEKAVAADAQDGDAKAAREKLQAVLDQLNPAAGKTAPSPDRPAKRVQRQNKRL